MSLYEFVVNQKGSNGQLIKEYILEQYQNHKYTFELSKKMNSVPSKKLAQAGCFIWAAFHNNDIVMYKKWKKKLLNQLNEMMDDLMFNSEKKTGIVEIDASYNKVTTGTNNSQGIVQFGAYMKETTETIDLLANNLLWDII